MKIKEGFFLKKIENDVFLLPYGNRIASFEHGLQLIGSSECIVRFLLEKGEASVEELLSMLEETYGDGVSSTELAEDLDGLLLRLQQYGVIEGQIQPVCTRVEEQHCFTIAGIHMVLNAPKDYVHPLLKPFASQGCDKDIEIQIAYYERNDYSEGTILVRSRDVVIYEYKNTYGFLYPENKYVREMIVTQDGKNATVFLKQMTPDVAEEAFLAMRSAFLIYASQHRLFALHSVSVAFRNGVVLFSGHSGAGKSTHSRLWERLFDSRILNGDLNLLGMEDGKVIVYGIPWCGTSEIAQPFKKNLWGVFFIHQSNGNTCKEIQGAQRTLALSNRMISPSWTKNLYEQNLAFAYEVQPKIMLCNLFCNTEDEAAKVARQYVISYIEEEDKNKTI